MKTLYKNIPIRYRISIALVVLMIGSIMIASAAGFFPNEQAAILRQRAKLSVTLAINASALLTAKQPGLCKLSLDGIVERDDQILSVSLINQEQEVVVSSGSHPERWDEALENGIHQMRVPVFKGETQWGEMRLRFSDTGGWMGLNYWAPAWLLIVLIPACFTQFSFFLRRTLNSLDTSGAVPEHVENTLNTFSVGLVLLNERGQIIFSNVRFDEYLSLGKDKILGQPLSHLDCRLPEVAPEQSDTELPWEIARDTGRPISERIVQRHVNDRLLTFTVNSTPIGGKGFLVTFDDITLIEENKVALAQARDEAQNANEAKSQFLANMSHEIRTPLNAVLGFTDVLRRGLVTDSNEAHGHLNMIHRSGAHLLELINDILDLSKIESGRLQVETIDTQIDHLIVDVAETLRVRADENDLDLNVRFDTAIPRVIQSDPTRLRQVITNLVGNAIKFTESGSVTIATHLVDATNDSPPHLEVNVIDTGIGMTKDQQAKIFEKFVQADTSTTRKFGGTGLGLSISRQLAEAMGGSLTVDGEPGVGSTFTVSIPVAEMTLQDLVDPQEIAALAKERADSAMSGGLIRLPSNQSILVVDDGEGNRRLIEVVLKRAGAKVVCASNGLEAIEAIAEQDFAIILMDMQMPVVDGYTATKRLRAAGLKTPIVALTGNAMKGDRERCLAAGCDDFVTKPVNIDQLLEVIASYIGYGEASEDETNQTLSLKSSMQLGPPQSENETISTGTGTGPIYPTLPMDDPDFREITSGFVDRLPERFTKMRQHLDNGDFESLREDAHWLKGAGGTVGLGVFGTPAAELEIAAKQEDASLTNRLIQQLENLLDRIVIDETAGGSVESCDSVISPKVAIESESSPDQSIIHCDMPLDDEDFRRIIADFIARLDVRFKTLTQAANENDYEVMAAEAHWMIGSAGTVGYGCFVSPAMDLLECAMREDSQGCEKVVRHILEMRGRLEVPEPNAPQNAISS